MRIEYFNPKKTDWNIIVQSPKASGKKNEDPPNYEFNHWVSNDMILFETYQNSRL